MKKSILLAFSFLLSAFALKAQELPPYNRSNANQVFADRATLSHFFMGIPHGATASFPAYVADSVKCGALYYQTSDSSLYVYNCAAHVWAKESPSQTLALAQHYADSLKTQLLTGGNKFTGPDTIVNITASTVVVQSPGFFWQNPNISTTVPAPMNDLFLYQMHGLGDSVKAISAANFATWLASQSAFTGYAPATGSATYASVAGSNSYSGSNAFGGTFEFYTSPQLSSGNNIRFSSAYTSSNDIFLGHNDEGSSSGFPRLVVTGAILEGSSDYSSKVDANSYIQKTYADAAYAPVTGSGSYAPASEVSRAEAAEATNATAIGTETSRAETAEGTKQDVSLASISALQSYTGAMTSVIVRDPLQGGQFNYVASGLTLDSAFVFPRSGGGYWQRQWQNNGSYPADYWGIKRDSSVDESALMQQAIDFIYRQGGGTLQLGSGGAKYIAGNMHLRSNVMIQGDHQNITFYAGVSPNSQHSVSITAAPGDTVIFNTLGPPTDGSLVACSTAHIRGISFFGTGTSSKCIGIHLRSWRRGDIEDCSFENFDEQFIWADKPGSSNRSGGVYLKDIWAAVGCLDTATTGIAKRMKAGIEIHSNDLYMDNVLSSPMTTAASTFTPTGHGNIYAAFIDGGTPKIQNCVFQYADVGLMVDSTTSAGLIANNNSDETSRQGLILRGCADNTITNFTVKRAGQEANATYNAIDVINGAQRNVLTGLGFQATGGNGDLPAYLVNETLSTTTVTNKNIIGFAEAIASCYATGRFNGVTNSSFVYGSENQEPDATSTPNVNGFNYIVSSSSTITSLSGGTPGQQVMIHFTVACAVTSGSGITLANGTTTFPAGSSLILRNYAGTFYEPSNSVSDLQAYSGSGDVAAQTSTGTVFSFTSYPAANATYSITGYLNTASIATDVIQLQVTYTDQNSNARTLNSSNVSTASLNSFTGVIRVKANTTVTLKTNLVTSGGSVTFDAGGAIKKLY